MRKLYCLLLFSLPLFNVVQVALADEAIRVLKVEGNAIEKMSRSTQKLQVGSTIQPGHILELEEGSSLVVSLGKDVVTKIAGPASGKFESLQGKDWRLNLDRGITASAVRNPEKRPNHFSVKTRSAVMGVRGTVFFVKSQPNLPDFLCTCKGTVAVQSYRGYEIDVITATHHDRPVTLNSGSIPGEITSQKADMGKDHSDADVKFLEDTLKELKP